MEFNSSLGNKSEGLERKEKKKETSDDTEAKKVTPMERDEIGRVNPYLGKREASPVPWGGLVPVQASARSQDSGAFARAI